MKKIWLLIMLLCVILILAGCGEGKGFRYTKLPDGTVQITAYTGKKKDVIIPAELKRRPVSAIGREAFMDCSTITNVTLPDGLVSIGVGAFQNCSKLTTILIPDSVTEVGSRAFKNCDSLKQAPFPKGITFIPVEYLSGADGLTSVVIPEGVTEIGKEAFEKCQSLTSVDLPSTVISLGVSSFSDCGKLTEINLPEGLQSIGESAFAHLPRLASLRIPESVTAIGINAFGHETIYVRTGVAFRIEVGKDSYAEQYAREKNIPFSYFIDQNSETETSKYSYALLDDGTAKIMRYLGSEQQVTVPSELDGYPVTVIGNHAFNECSWVTEIVLPEGIHTISTQAFSRCYNLTDISLPESLQTIKSSAFECCSFSEISIPAGVTMVDSHAFSECSDLTSITFHGMSTAINFTAFNEIPHDQIVLTVLPDSAPEEYARTFKRNYVLFNE